MFLRGIYQNILLVTCYLLHVTRQLFRIILIMYLVYPALKTQILKYNG